MPRAPSGRREGAAHLTTQPISGSDCLASQPWPGIFQTQTNRDIINTFAPCSGLAAVFDGLVWHGVKGLKIY